MAYDETLAERIREYLADQPDITVAKMFGGIAFIVGGRMAISASGQGGVLVHVDPATAANLIARTNAEVAVMRGRPMNGWLRVKSEDLTTRTKLVKWVDRGTSYARSLPAKTPKRERS